MIIYYADPRFTQCQNMITLRSYLLAASPPCIFDLDQTASCAQLSDLVLATPVKPQVPEKACTWQSIWINMQLSWSVGRLLYAGARVFRRFGLNCLL